MGSSLACLIACILKRYNFNGSQNRLRIKPIFPLPFRHKLSQIDENNLENQCNFLYALENDSFRWLPSFYENLDPKCRECTGFLGFAQFCQSDVIFPELSLTMWIVVYLTQLFDIKKWPFVHNLSLQISSIDKWQLRYNSNLIKFSDQCKKEQLFPNTSIFSMT